jgi:2-oxoglutarate dehydrogenase complex dehydrogenase (E1) component-like enzyme
MVVCVDQERRVLHPQVGTHQTPAFANSTIRCPDRAPATRPRISAVRSEPPEAAAGT